MKLPIIISSSMLALLSAFQQSAAFSIITSTSSAATSRTRTIYNLRPGQGAQLEAAFLASIPDEDDDHHIVHVKSSAPATKPDKTIHIAPDIPMLVTPIRTARAFASRLFAIPSVPHQNDISITTTSTGANDEGSVLYPIVGFKMVKDGGNHMRVLPTTSSVACALPSKDEELYGWYSPGCHLDLFQENIALQSIKHVRNDNDGNNITSHKFNSSIVVTKYKDKY